MISGNHRPHKNYLKGRQFDTPDSKRWPTILIYNIVELLVSNNCGKLKEMENQLSGEQPSFLI